MLVVLNLCPCLLDLNLNQIVVFFVDIDLLLQKILGSLQLRGQFSFFLFKFFKVFAQCFLTEFLLARASDSVEEVFLLPVRFVAIVVEVLHQLSKHGRVFLGQLRLDLIDCQSTWVVVSLHLPEFLLEVIFVFVVALVLALELFCFICVLYNVVSGLLDFVILLGYLGLKSLQLVQIRLVSFLGKERLFHDVIELPLQLVSLLSRCLDLILEVLHLVTCAYCFSVLLLKSNLAGGEFVELV